MRWRTDRRSTNVEDRRGSSSSRIPGGAAGGIGGIGLIIILVAAVLLGVDPGQFIGGSDIPTGSFTQQSELTQEDQDVFNSSVRVFTDTEQTWAILFEDQLKSTYSPPTLVVFTDYVDTACGQATSDTGPFYCSADQTVYIDLEFYKELEQRFGAPGDFAQAYVISHEVGHHVQNLVGTLNYVNRAQSRMSEADANELSVALELQADCYAGVWAYQAQYGDLILEKGDLEEALNAASAIGDDKIQMQSMGYVVPDTFTHGTSAQRVAWFRKGMDAGQIADCNCPELPAVG
jgi:predicted metalloprotease